MGAFFVFGWGYAGVTSPNDCNPAWGTDGPTLSPISGTEACEDPSPLVCGFGLPFERVRSG